ncbi:hypothetical protein Bca52824_036194 [Brassica carinata]|uniref:Uncharacterized protein n=1 Tax=Brassica carinata TaxID=52824 RepID=A0A8X7S4G8_BRACI|nr:hypothetical protein Bca52824_036194 [Brassica carinata]
MVIDFSTSKNSPSSSSSSWWLRGKVIGRGCFGTVNLAVNKSDSDHIFAVKSVGLATCIPRQLDSLENEICILRSVSSPHVVRFLGDDVTREGTWSFRNLHLEYMPRGTLADVAGHNLEEDMIRRFTWCLVSALKDVHMCGFVHCDVKARNVLLAEEPGSAKLADFGSGLEIQPENRTGCGSHMQPRGSPLWMAPEVVRGECQGPESDVWSLGCTIIEMVTGKPPWINDGAESLRTIGFSDDLPKFPARLSETGRNFLEKCLRRDPSERWSCDQLLQHPFISCSALSESPRHVFDWEDSVFEEEEAVGSEPVSESSSTLARERIGTLASSRVVIWEFDGWLVVRGSETPQLVPDSSSCTELTVLQFEREDGEHREEEAEVHEDEDTGAQVAPIVRLEEVAVTTGEEDEDAVLDLKSKLYRFDKEGKQWKERGAGTVKLLKHKETGKILKIAIIVSTDCKTFMEKFTEIAESQQVGKDSKEGDEAAGLLENLSVEDQTSEEKAKEEAKGESPVK